MANSTVALRETAEEKVREEMITKMSESFDALVIAAEASKTIYEDQARTIAMLNTANAKLEKTKKTHGQICRAL